MAQILGSSGRIILNSQLLAFFFLITEGDFLISCRGPEVSNVHHLLAKCLPRSPRNPTLITHARIGHAKPDQKAYGALRM